MEIKTEFDDSDEDENILNFEDIIDSENSLYKNYSKNQNDDSKPKNIHTLEININKAGMEGLDASKINEIIQKASEGSKFYQHKQRCQERIDAKISQMKTAIAKFQKEQIEKAEREMTKLGLEMLNERDLTRTIVHIDMDMFYAAVEMRDNPSLRDKPMAVGGNSMLSTSNYAARKYGVRAAMPGFIGKKLCPDLIIVPCNFNKYREVSSQVQSIFEEYDPNFCPMSLDEAYLDITDYLNDNAAKYSSSKGSGLTPAELIVEEIRRRIQEKTRLTASAGIAPNTRLSKICSDLNKPNGQYFLKPDQKVIQEFVNELPIRKVSGIGNVTEQQLRALGVVTCSDLWTHRGLIRLLFSDTSYKYFLSIALGLGSTEVSPAAERERKSISNETTFSGTSDRNCLIKICEDLCKELKDDMIRKNLVGKVFTLKMKTTNFQIRTRAQTLLEYTQDEQVMAAAAQKLLITEINSEPSNKPLSLRLLGVRMSNLLDRNLIKAKKQLTLTNLLKNSCKTEISEHKDGDIIVSKFNLIERKERELDAFESKSSRTVSSSFSFVDKTSSSIEEANSDNKHCLRVTSTATTKDDSLCNGDETHDQNVTNTDTTLNSSFTCPVCNKSTLSNVQDLNSHLDICLNQDVVSKLVKETNVEISNSENLKPKIYPQKSNSTLKTKRKANNQSNSNKKARGKCSSGSNSLLKYLVSEK